MRVGVVGLNHKIADLQLRDAIAKACHKSFCLASEHSEGFYVVLSTCNRTEVYFSSDDLALSHSYILEVLRRDLNDDFQPRLYSYFGADCFYHLARVTAGLDSAIVGETEIQGQVKRSYESASENDRLPAILHFMFQKALKIGKHLRSTVLQNRAEYDLEHAITDASRHFFSDHRQARLLFVGASEINHKLYKHFASVGIESMSLCNRSVDSALRFADPLQVDFVSWRDLGSWTEYDWVIFGTKSPDFVVRGDELPDELEGGGRLLIDLSVPRNVDPMVARHRDVSLLNIDQVNRMVDHKRRRLGANVSCAEAMVKDLSNRQVELFLEKEKARQQKIAVGA